MDFQNRDRGQARPSSTARGGRRRKRDGVGTAGATTGGLLVGEFFPLGKGSTTTTMRPNYFGGPIHHFGPILFRIL